MAQTVIGTTLVAAGTSALNHYLERDSDARMRRTARAPASQRRAGSGGSALVRRRAWRPPASLELLLTTNVLATLLAPRTCVTYLGVYTPLKTRTTLATLIGAFPGAVPPLIGWAAARGSLGPGAWVLFAILFLWQVPHFHAISWMYREDYGRAGIRMLPVVDPDGRATFGQILVLRRGSDSREPARFGHRPRRRAVLFFGALVLGMLLVEVCLWAAARKTNVRAKWLMHATVLHLPLLLGLMMFDKFSR